MRETMCRDEYIEFCAIKTERTSNLKEYMRNKISKEDFIERCDDLMSRLEKLKNKYDEVYLKEEINKKGTKLV